MIKDMLLKKQYNYVEEQKKAEKEKQNQESAREFERLKRQEITLFEYLGIKE